MAAEGDETRGAIRDPSTAHLTRLARAHERIAHCVTELESARDTDGILERLEELLRILPEHFSVDEEGPDGFFDELRTIRPALDPQLKLLEREHREMLTALEALQSRVREAGEDFSRIQEHRAAWIRRIRAHEDTENQIALEAYFLDEGGLG